MRPGDAPPGDIGSSCRPFPASAMASDDLPSLVRQSAREVHRTSIRVEFKSPAKLLASGRPVPALVTQVIGARGVALREIAITRNRYRCCAFAERITPVV
jgi:hypothetical protein